jgi:3-oxoadipate enol-lactonase
VRTVISGREIGYDDVGDGPPLLLLHAFPLSRRMWAPQIAALSGRMRCIAPDTRGFGESAAEPPFTMDRYADDAIELLDALGVSERVAVCGLSMGGYVSFALWHRHADRVRALVLADTRATADTPEGKRKRAAMIELARSRGAAAVAEQQAPALLSKRTAERCPELLDTVRTMITAQSPEAIVGASEAMMHRPDSTPTLGTITVPTLIIVGSDDTVTPPSDAETMHRAIPGSRLERIPNAGHLSNLERPAAFNAVLAEFLDSLG